MSELACRKRLRRLIAPVRPSWKERYPLTPIERYITWRREDGQLLDPWMRLQRGRSDTMRSEVQMPRSPRRAPSPVCATIRA
jgi:hypothetical protein